ncbi:hypothetical protein DPMN_144718 [Dreissena polymorpha]|uniref:Uncharacterized protein n=1 Tax=Dreissena polymorpha TaxID=45954 RepID=A0A9D4F7B8_DREPO|nr:hypothetical protein DPMN_144718 [Dreissena polymorpha]
MMGKICTKKNAPPTGGHVFQATGTIFELVQNIIGTKLLTNLYDDRTINMASRVLTMKNATPPWRPYIIGTNHLTKFHDDRTINVASRVLTRKNAPPPDIIRTNLLNKFHEDQKINVASRVLTRTNAPPPLRPYIIGMNLLTKEKCPAPWQPYWTINVASIVFTRKNAPTLSSLPCFSGKRKLKIFKLIQDIIQTKLLTKFHEDWQINVAFRVLTRKSAPPPGGHFHDDCAKIVTSRVFIRNTALPSGSHLHEDWASNVTSTVFTSFELSRGFNGTNVLTKFHEDQKINVASRVFTRQNVDDGRRTTDKS